MDRSNNHEQGIFEGRVLSRLDSIETTSQDIKIWMIQQEGRLRVLEQEQSKAKGIAIAVGAFAGMVSGMLAKLWWK